VRRLLGTLAGIVRFERDVLAGFLEHDCPTLAAAIAYYALLSIFPLVLAATAIGAQFVDEASVRASLRQTLALYLPSDAVALVLRNVEEAIRARGTVGIAAILTSLWTSSAVAGAARHGLNRVWGVAHARVFWRRKLVEIFVTVTVGTILAASLLFSIALSVLERFTPPTVLKVLRAVPGLGVARVVLPVGLTFLGLLVSYGLLPNRPVRLGWLWPGALGAAVLFELVRRIAFWGIGTFARYQLVYGSLAGVVIFLVWAYLAAVIFLLGAEISRCASGGAASGNPP
jgi:membrane protein